jgi:hypothetical protein
MADNPFKKAKNSASSFISDTFQTNEGSGKYDIKNYSYPSDIMTPLQTYGGNYAIFYINVAIDSKLFKDKDNPVETISPLDVPTRLRGDLLAKDRSLTSLVASSTAAGAFIGAVGGGLFSGNASGSAKGAAAGGAGGAIVSGAVASTAASATRNQKRLKTAIALHIPNQLAIRYSTNWEAEETLGFQAAEDIIKALGSGASMTDVAEKAKNTGGVARDIVASVGMSQAPGGAAISAATGLAANPKKEQVFKGLDYRSFQFDYMFFPRDEAEAKNVMNIIKEFKYHMHPEYKGDSTYLWIYPSEFDITYYNRGLENEHIHKHTSCVLTEMNVNYTPNGQFTSFANGMPTQIQISLSFRELGLLNKDLIKEGL